MNFKQTEGLAEQLLAKGLVYSPVKKEKKIRVERVENTGEIDWSSDLPENPFKFAFLPAQEALWEIGGNDKIKISPPADTREFVWGVNILDLRAFTLFEQVFGKDFYYQQRRQNLYVVGYANGIESDLRKYQVFEKEYEANVLEHVVFDIFIERQKNDNFVIFSGSEKGQALLEECGIQDYENIEFAGTVPEENVKPAWLIPRQAVVASEKNALWTKLAEICLACGKCSVGCPTCYCFDLKDEPDLNSVARERQWASCFYPEFSKMAGVKILDSTRARLYYWYYHKFVRIPDEFSLPGCVRCGRCVRTCPVGIDIGKNIKELITTFAPKN